MRPSLLCLPLIEPSGPSFLVQPVQHQIVQGNVCRRRASQCGSATGTRMLVGRRPSQVMSLSGRGGTVPVTVKGNTGPGHPPCVRCKSSSGHRAADVSGGGKQPPASDPYGSGQSPRRRYYEPCPRNFSSVGGTGPPSVLGATFLEEEGHSRREHVYTRSHSPPVNETRK